VIMSFDFQKLEIYKKAKCFNENIGSLVSRKSIRNPAKDQLLRA
jgi:hypothetical protein